MKKTLLLLILLTTSCFLALAQTSSGIKISIGPEIGKPLGSAEQSFNLEYGASAKLEIPFAASGPDFTVSAGYEVFNISGIFAQYNLSNSKYIPLSVGLKAYLQNSQVYAEGDIGASVYANSGYTGNRVGNLYSAGLGFTVAQKKIDISARYEARRQEGYTLPMIAFRIAYKFALK